MSNVFIIHGSYGYPGENWFPWLKDELEKLKQRVFVPQFPVPTKPDLAYGGHDIEKWLKTFEKYSQYVDNETIIVAHSRGCVFSYHFLMRKKHPIKAVFLVAPWMFYHWYPPGWNKVDSFHKHPFNWEQIKRGSRYFEVFQSSNDDTPVDEGRQLANKLGAKFVLVENAGHFNTRSGYSKFPLLFEHIRSIL